MGKTLPNRLTFSRKSDHKAIEFNNFWGRSEMRILSFFAMLPVTIQVLPVLAQTYIQPPEFQQVDKNGVDLLSGSASRAIELGTIGAGDGQLSFLQYAMSGGMRNNLGAIVWRYQDDNNLQTYVSVALDDSSKLFIRQSDGSYTAIRGVTESLVESADGRTFQYTRKNGEIVTYSIPPDVLNPGSNYCTSNSANSPWAQCSLKLLSRAFPNGVTWTYNWQSVGQYYTRPISVSNNLGYKIAVTYLSNDTPTINNQGAWEFVTNIDFYNLALSTSPLASATRGGVAGMPYAIQMTTIGGQSWIINGSPDADTGGTFSVKTPSSSSINFTYTPKSGGSTTAVTNGLIYNYDFYLSGSTGITTATDPTGSSIKINYIRQTSKVSSVAFPQSMTDGLNRVTAFETFKQGSLITSVMRPEGDKDVFQYDARDNITLVTHKAKPGSGLADLTETASFPSSCTNVKICNRPTSTTDKGGNTTDYTYAPEHGGLLTKSQPPGPNGIRPVTRYGYVQRYAWISNGAGGYTMTSAPVWLKTEERTCRTTQTVGNACAGGSADEAVTTYEYGPDSGPNNLLLRGMTVSTNGQVQRTCYTYDALGRKVSETKPLGTGGNCP